MSFIGRIYKIFAGLTGFIMYILSESCKSCLTTLLKYDVRGFFTNHIDRTNNEEPGDAWEHRGIDDTQPTRAVNTEVTIEHTVLLNRPDRARARRVMSPRMLPHKRLQVVNTLTILARNLLRHDQILVLELRRQLTHKLYPFDDCFKILVTTFFKVMKVDARRVAWIC